MADRRARLSTGSLLDKPGTDPVAAREIATVLEEVLERPLERAR